MTDGDEILSGFFIAGISAFGIAILSLYIRNKCSKPVMKESTSETNLTNLGDPEQV
jgi:hypothetical protein